MGILSIKIRIGDRDYPMKVEEGDEETLRVAGKLLNERLKAFKENYQIEDRQDLLAMVAFDGLVTQIKSQHEKLENENQIVDKINYLSSLISKSVND
ncbi:MAG: cell division protein ZapA [Bacteroidota bacterium]|nr:cell division protein ZapA [Bacteroidota bacterium]